MRLLFRRRSTIRPGQVRELHKLGVTSRYRVLGITNGLVLVEATDTGVLPVGTQIRLTAAAVEAMRIVSDQSIDHNKED